MDPLRPVDSPMQLLTKVMDLRAESAQLISANIANAETPGYSAKHLDFEEDLANAINKTKRMQLTTSQPGHIPIAATNFSDVAGKVVVTKDETGIGDENSVSVDSEMLALSENELLYETATQLYKKKSSMLKYVISGGQ